MESRSRVPAPVERPGVTAVRMALLNGQASPLAKTVLLVVLDANVLLRDIGARLRYRQYTFLQQAAGFGTFRLFATEQVRAEVTAHLREFIQGYGLDSDMAARLWTREYGRLIRFVTVPDTHPDPRVAVVAALHAADAPTAILAVMLAPCLLLSTDKASLGKAGLAAIEWFPLAQQAAVAVPEGDAVLVGSDLLMRVSFAPAWGLGKGIASLWRTRPEIALLLGLALLIGIDYARRSEGVRAMAAQMRTRAARAGESAAARVTAHQHAVTALSRAEVKPSHDHPLCDHIARTLALAGQLSRTKIAETLRTKGVGHGREFPTVVDSLLRGCPAFLPAPRRRWELGRHFGLGRQPPEAEGRVSVDL